MFGGPKPGPFSAQVNVQNRDAKLGTGASLCVRPMLKSPHLLRDLPTVKHCQRVPSTRYRGQVMRKLEGTMLTTHVDMDGERLAVEGLESFAATINGYYLPFTVEHDIRNAPIGRVTSAAIVGLEDGEFAVKGTFEVFEQGDTMSSLRGDGRKIRIVCDDIPTFNVEYDRSYETTEGRELLAALSRLSPESGAIVQVKKSVAPISTLIIATTIVSTAIATGFFGKLGEDLYAGLKNILKAHFGSCKDSKERLLDFEFTTTRHGEPIDIHVLLTNPTPEEIEALFSCRFGDLDSYLSRCEGLDSAARFVFEYKNGRLESLYVLRGDCVPLKLRRAVSR